MQRRQVLCRRGVWWKKRVQMGRVKMTMTMVTQSLLMWSSKVTRADSVMPMMLMMFLLLLMLLLRSLVAGAAAAGCGGGGGGGDCLQAVAREPSAGAQQRGVG